MKVSNTFSVYLHFFILGMFLSGVSFNNAYAQSDQVCHVVIDGNPINLDGMFIDLPLDYVALDPNIQVFPPDVTVQSGIKVTSSIVLIIDDSGSMIHNDPDGNRYVVTREILDEIYETSPKSRVGVVAFRNWLAWDWRENDMFSKISDPFEWNDSYFPCVPLDSVFADGERGIDKIKNLFTVDQWNLLQAFHENDSTERTRPLQPDGTRSTKSQQGTDITLAFSAAKDALRHSPTPRERQFFIFLSDGYHGSVDEEMEATKLDYIDGEEVPTTFSIFLGDSVKEPPEQLEMMVTNIRQNGYSRTNGKSELWSIESNHDTLLALMQREILDEMFVPSLKLSSAEISGSVSMSSQDSTILLEDAYPLEEDTTKLNLRYTFSYIDSAGDGSRFDTTFETSFGFVRSASASLDQFPPELSSVCYDRSIDLRFGDQQISNLVSSQQSPLAVDLTLQGVRQQTFATATNEENSDFVIVALTPDDDIYSGTFGQETGTAVVDDDDVLQYSGIDSLIITWRHPALPLDTMRRAWYLVPYNPVKINTVEYRDLDADGLIDAIIVKSDNAINPREEAELDQDRFGFPSHRALNFKDVTFNDDGMGFTISVSQDPNGDVSTAVTENDQLLIKEYDIGPFDNFVEKGSYRIEDGIAPVLTSATYIPSVNETGSATVKVEFSEDIEPISSRRPFKFKTPQGREYTLELELISQSLSTAEFKVISSSDDQLVPSSRDSMWISEDAMISDTFGNTQIEPNRKIGLRLAYPKYEMSAVVLPNPVKVGSVNPLEQFGAGTGTVIVISPDDFVKNMARVEKIEVKIFDSVGNLLAQELPVKRQNGLVYVHWDGYNINGRLVSSGVYLGLIRTETVLEGEKREHTVRVKIGFRI